MPWVYIICFALVAAGLLTLFGVRPGDFIDALFRSQRKSATLTDELNVLMGIPAKGFFNQDFELKQILKGTGRTDRYEAVKRLSLILFAVGGALALLIGNVYMVPILGIGFSLAPIWYALYDLLSSLGIIPASGSMLMRSISFVKLVAGRRVPIQQALKLFQKDRRTDYETRVMRLAQQALLSTAEIIKCVEQDVAYLPNEQFLMEAVYGDDETTCYNIAGIMKNSRSSQAVTLAVANLYLRQQIIFERITT